MLKIFGLKRGFGIEPQWFCVSCSFFIYLHSIPCVVGEHALWQMRFDFRGAGGERGVGGGGGGGEGGIKGGSFFSF